MHGLTKVKFMLRTFADLPVRSSEYCAYNRMISECTL